MGKVILSAKKRPASCYLSIMRRIARTLELRHSRRRQRLSATKRNNEKETVDRGKRSGCCLERIVGPLAATRPNISEADNPHGLSDDAPTLGDASYTHRHPLASMAADTGSHAGSEPFKTHLRVGIRLHKREQKQSKPLVAQRQAEPQPRLKMNAAIQTDTQTDEATAVGSGALLGCWSN